MKYISRNNEKDFTVRECVDNLESTTPKLILILESPHIFELNTKSNGPAKGTTGRLIRKKLHEVSRNIKFKNKDLPLVLMNAVQYQCSLGANLKEVKNKKMRDCFEAHIPHHGLELVYAYIVIKVLTHFSQKKAKCSTSKRILKYV